MEGAPVWQRPGNGGPGSTSSFSFSTDVTPALHKAAAAIGTYFQKVSSGWKPFDVVMDKATQLLMGLLDPRHPDQTLLSGAPPHQLHALAEALHACTFQLVADTCEAEPIQGVPIDKVAFTLAGAVQKAAAALAAAAREADWQPSSSKPSRSQSPHEDEEEAAERARGLSRVPSTSDVSAVSGAADGMQPHSRRSSMSGAEGSTGPSPSDTPTDPASRPSPEVRDKLKQAAHDVAVYLSSPAARSATFDVVRQRVQGEVWYALDPSKRLRSSGQPQQLLRMAKGLRGLLGEVTGLVEEGCAGFDAREVAKVMYCMRGALPEAVSLLKSDAAKAMVALQQEMAALSGF